MDTYGPRVEVVAISNEWRFCFLPCPMIDCPPYCTACTWNTTINALDCDGGDSCANADKATVYITDPVAADTVAGVAIVAGQDYCKGERPLLSRLDTNIYYFLHCVELTYSETEKLSRREDDCMSGGNMKF